MSNNLDIIHSWQNGFEKGKQHRRLSTDGTSLYSYGLRIGMTHNNKKIVFNYTAKCAGFHSNTTSRHCALAVHESQPENVTNLCEDDYLKLH